MSKKEEEKKNIEEKKQAIVEQKKEEQKKAEQRGPVGQSEYGTAISDKSKKEEELSKLSPQIARAAKPTEEDVGTVQDPPEILKKTPPKTPQERAREQSIALMSSWEKASKKKIKKENQEENNPKLELTSSQEIPGIEDSAIPGSRVGDPTEAIAESFLGDKVHNLLESGSRLEVQSKDKSNSIPVISNLRTGNIIKKRKVSFLFPGINPEVAQKALEISITENPFNEEESKQYKVGEVFPPDVPNKEVLLPLNSRIHVELFHVDKNGYYSHPYILDFYTMVIRDPEFTRPLQASPIGYELMEEVNVYE